MKKDIAAMAAEWLKHIKETYPQEIQHSIEHSTIYDSSLEVAPAIKASPNRLLIKSDTAGFLYTTKGKELMNFGRCAVLNFADYVCAGGMFLEGLTAQEEALCHESILFPVLNSFEDSYYKIKSILVYRQGYLQ